VAVVVEPIPHPEPADGHGPFGVYCHGESSLRRLRTYAPSNCQPIQCHLLTFLGLLLVLVSKQDDNHRLVEWLVSIEYLIVHSFLAIAHHTYIIHKYSPGSSLSMSYSLPHCRGRSPFQNIPTALFNAFRRAQACTFKNERSDFWREDLELKTHCRRCGIVNQTRSTLGR
jgi:hypothetical protein